MDWVSVNRYVLSLQKSKLHVCVCECVCVFVSVFVSVCVRECICVYNDHAERQFLLLV